MEEKYLIIYYEIPVLNKDKSSRDHWYCGIHILRELWKKVVTLLELPKALDLYRWIGAPSLIRFSISKRLIYGCFWGFLRWSFCLFLKVYKKPTLPISFGDSLTFPKSKLKFCKWTLSFLFWLLFFGDSWWVFDVFTLKWDRKELFCIVLTSSPFSRSYYCFCAYMRCYTRFMRWNGLLRRSLMFVLWEGVWKG